ncbi:MAG: cell wall hydrolase [Novosphingobium sp.]
MDVSASSAVPSPSIGARETFARMMNRLGVQSLGSRLFPLAVAAGIALAGLALFHLAFTSGAPSVRAALPPPVEIPSYLPVTPETAKALNAAVPIIDAKPEPARPYHFEGSTEAKARAIDCLAAAAWYEAGDDTVGEQAVIQTVLNRARHPAFPRTVCGVVFQGSERTTGCQFSFTCDGSLGRIPSDAAWRRAQAAGKAGLSGYVDPQVGRATHYHADYVVPYWQSSLDKMAQVHAHLFYRWRGFWGTKAAFTGPSNADEPAIAKLATVSTVHRKAAEIENPGALDGPDATPSEAAIALPPPPPIQIDGIAEKSLRKAVVRGHTANANQFFIEVDGATFPGNYATAAVALCRNKNKCAVFGWRNSSQMATEWPITSPQFRELTFYFYHDETVGDSALWNCAQVERKNSAQCLPTDPSALVASRN